MSRRSSSKQPARGVSNAKFIDDDQIMMCWASRHACHMAASAENRHCESWRQPANRDRQQFIRTSQPAWDRCGFALPLHSTELPSEAFCLCLYEVSHLTLMQVTFSAATLSTRGMLQDRFSIKAPCYELYQGLRFDCMFSLSTHIHSPPPPPPPLLPTLWGASCWNLSA